MQFSLHQNIKYHNHEFGRKQNFMKVNIENLKVMVMADSEMENVKIENFQ